MITTLTMNPCIDHTAALCGLKVGGTNKVIASRDDPSGKGINVSLALKRMGYDNLCLSFEHAGNQLGDFLKENQISCRLVPTAGRLRVNLKLFDNFARTMTECNEKGSPITKAELASMLSLIEAQLASTDILALSGSVPQGVPEDFYRTVAELANQAKVKVILDADGPLLKNGCESAPFIIKPNLSELKNAFGFNGGTLEDAARFCQDLSKKYGIAFICLSMGENGALLASSEAAWFSKGGHPNVKGVQGAGDSMVAGLCAALSVGESDPALLLRWAVAAANASLELEGSQMCDKTGFEKMLPRVSARQLSI